LAAERTKIAEMSAFLGEHFSRPVEFSVKLLSAAELASNASSARSLVELSEERTREERGKREQEAREHPMTRMVLDTFGATIKEIKTDV
jgi:hypothetical protein